MVHQLKEKNVRLRVMSTTAVNAKLRERQFPDIFPPRPTICRVEHRITILHCSLNSNPDVN